MFEWNPEVVDIYDEPGDSRTEFAKLQVQLHVGILSKVGGSESEVVAFSLRLGHAHEKTTLSCFLTRSRRFATYDELDDDLPRLTKLQISLHAGILMKFVRMEPEAVVTYGEYW